MSFIGIPNRKDNDMGPALAILILAVAMYLSHRARRPARHYRGLPLVQIQARILLEHTLIPLQGG